MSLFAITCIAACVVSLLALAWCAARPLSQESPPHPGEPIEALLQQHALRLPQLRHSLADMNRRYVHRKATEQIEKNWRQERRRVVETFLLALGDDFARLEQLAALASAMLPQEFARQADIPASLQLQFRVNYRAAALLLSVGGLGCAGRITRLAELIGNLSMHTEANMSRLTHLPALESWGSLSRFRPD